MMDYSASSTIAVAQSRRFAFYNICRIRYFLTKDETQLLVEVLVISHLVYCNCWTVGLPASMTKSLQRIQNAAVCLVFNLPKFSCVNPSSVTSTGFLLWTASNLKMMVLTFKAAMEVPQSTSDHMPQHEHFALLHQLAGWYHHCWAQSCDTSLFCCFSGGTNFRPMSGQQSHLPSSPKDSRLICSPQPCIAWIPPFRIETAM